jgi:hypothetical protein
VRKCGMRELRVIELIGVRCPARRSCMKYLGGIGCIGTKSLHAVEFGVGRVAVIEVIRMRRKKRPRDDLFYRP